MDTLWQDVKFGLRTLAKNRAFSLAAILTLALAIGPNVAIFSLVDAVLLRPLAYRAPEQLVMLWEKPPKFDHNTISAANFLDWKEQARSFEAMAGIYNKSMVLTGSGDAEQIPAQFVSVSFFDILGIAPKQGRGFQVADEDSSRGPVSIISNGLWLRRFGGDPQIVGKSIELDGTSYTVIGVLPPRFRLMERCDIWIPLVLRHDTAKRNSHFLRAIARLKPGITIDAARAEMTAITDQIARISPETNQGWGVRVNPLQQDLIGSDLRSTSQVLLVVVGFVLLIACANVAGLLLVRGAGRAREIAVRSSLGAGRARIARQLITESTLLSLAGATVGLLLAKLALDTAPVWLPAGTLPDLVQLELNGRVLTFTALAAILTGLLCGLAPALHAGRVNLNEALRTSGYSSTAGTHVRRVLAIAELAIAVVLLTGGALLIRTLFALQHVDRGYRADRVLSFHISLPPRRYATPEAINLFHQKTLAELNALPGVHAAALAYDLPMEGWTYGSRFEFGARSQTLPAGLPFAHLQAVSPRYFDVLEIPLLRGRSFTEADTPKSQPACIINQELASRYSANADPLGRQFFPDDGYPSGCRIVGVSGQVKIQGPAEASRFEFYIPYTVVAPASVVYGLRTDVDPMGLAPIVRQIMQKIDGDIPLVNTRTIEEIASDSVARPRFRAGLIGAFASLALLLAVIGTYGVLAYAVTQRTREFGIRMALGARAPDILRLVLGDGLQMTLLGIAVGLAAATGLTRYLSSMLFGVRPLDPVTFATVPLLLALAALAACYVPGRRAVCVDPLAALRYE